MPKAKAKTSTEGVGEFLKRSMRGTSFLALEHTMHILLTLVVAGLAVAGGLLAVSMAFSQPLGMTMGMHGDMPGLFAVASTQLQGMCALMIAAALAVLSPFLVILDRRTRAEWSKRPGFTGRLAYKLPIYIALGVVWLIDLSAIIAMVWVLLYSLATLGTANALVLGAIYAVKFIPAAVTLVVFGLVGWYLIRLGQGQNRSQTFSLALATVGGLLALTLLVTGVLTLQNPALPSQPTLDDYLRGTTSPLDYQKMYKY